MIPGDRQTLGVCSVCQQSELKLKTLQTDKKVLVLQDHDHQGGQLCEGSGMEPETVYTPKKSLSNTPAGSPA